MGALAPSVDAMIRYMTLKKASCQCIAMPDEQSFEGMKHLAEYFFEDMSREMVTEKAGRKKEQERS